MKVEERVEEIKIDFRKKAEKWAEEKAEKKAIELFEKEKEISNEMRIFKDEQIRL